MKPSRIGINFSFFIQVVALFSPLPSLGGGGGPIGCKGAIFVFLVTMAVFIGFFSLLYYAFTYSP